VNAEDDGAEVCFAAGTESSASSDDGCMELLWRILWRIDPLLGKDLETNEYSVLEQRLGKHVPAERISWLSLGNR
jgi:hypothetical protein